MGKKINVLRFDNVGEYTSDLFLQLRRDEGIERHFIIRKTPKQNRVTEMMNSTLLEKIWCILSNAGLLKYFWLRHWHILTISLTGCRRR